MLLEKKIKKAQNFVRIIIDADINLVDILELENDGDLKYINKIDVIVEAIEYCEEREIIVRPISFSILSSILGYASEVCDKILKSKWAILLANILDKKQDLENELLPYILRQLSSIEFRVLEEAIIGKDLFYKRLNEEMAIIEVEFPANEKILLQKLDNCDGDNQLKDQLLKEYKNSRNSRNEMASLYNEATTISGFKLTTIEKLNLVRLGLAETRSKEINEVEMRTPTIEEEIKFGRNFKTNDYIEVSYEVDYLEVTKLGEIFIKACSPFETLPHLND